MEPRSLLLNLAASLVMGGLLLCLALRAAGELLGLSLTAAREAPMSAPPRREARRAWPDWAVFLFPLLLLWCLTLLAYLTGRRGDGSLSGFFFHFLDRFTTAGDAPHYLYLAEHGYASAGEKINLIVFYPLYPFLTGMLGRALGGRYILAGLLLSQLSYGAASLLLWRLAKLDTEHPERVMWAFWLYPLAFFALGVFTEGLFLALSIGCLYALRREKWAAAGIAGFFCLLCRAQGIALLPAFVYAVWHTARRSGLSLRMLWGLGLPAGWGVYLCLNRFYAGSFFAFRYYESLPPWWQTTQWLGKTIAQQADMALAYPFLGKIIYWPQLVLYFLASALLFAALYRRLPTEEVVHGAAYLGMCYLAGWLISGGRYMLGCTAMYLAAGRFRRPGAVWLMLGAELLSCAWFYWNFMDGQSIM